MDQSILIQIAPVLAQYDVPLRLVAAIIQVESSWNVRAQGDKRGDVYTSFGIFQLHLGGQADAAINDGYSTQDLFDSVINAKYAMPAIASAWDALKSTFDANSNAWWLRYSAMSGHPGGSSSDPATINEAKALQAAYASLSTLEGGNMQTNSKGEIVNVAEADQFQQSGNGQWLTQFACGYFACYMAASMAKVGQSPTLTPAQVITKAEAAYSQYDGDNSINNSNGMTLEQEYELLQQIGLHYQSTSTDINVVMRWIEAGYPVIIAITEVSVFDMDLGRNPYTAWTPSGTHIILCTGVTSDGNVLVRDSANCTNLYDPNSLRPGPRKYKAANLQLVSATAVVPSWLPRPTSSTPPIITEEGTLLQLTDPMGKYFIAVNDQRWHCVKTNVDLAYGFLSYYRLYGGMFGLPLTGEFSLAQWPGVTFQVFERGILVFDEKRIFDNPPIPGNVYLAHIDKSVGQSTLAKSLTDPLNAQVKTLMSQVTALNAQITTLQQQPADVSTLQSQVESLTSQLAAAKTQLSQFLQVETLLKQAYQALPAA